MHNANKINKAILYYIVLFDKTRTKSDVPFIISNDIIFILISCTNERH